MLQIKHVNHLSDFNLARILTSRILFEIFENCSFLVIAKEIKKITNRA